MIRTGLLNPAVLSLLARVRHTNTLVLADRGFPFWPGLETVDLSLVDDVPTVAQVFDAINEGKSKPFTAEDVRFTAKGDTLYAIVMGAPTAAVNLKSLGSTTGLPASSVAEIALVGSDEKLAWLQTDDSLVIQAPRGAVSDIATVFKITTR